MLALLLALSAPAADAAAPPTAPAPTATAPATATATATATGGEVVVDAVLPCGLRVLTARDMTLPVAAVTLVVETGSEDDPPELPGLVHAMAYQVEQGNRELRPGEAMATAQDAGGVYHLTTGLAQVRYESVVPMSRLDAVLWLESQRLRYPTANAARWKQTLGWAASDDRTSSRLRPEALAYVFGAPGLGHEPRAAEKQLAGVVEGALAAQLAGKFNYPRATLVVIAPESPEKLLARISPLFADLPQAPHAPPQRTIGPRPAVSGGAPVAAGGNPGAAPAAGGGEATALPPTVPLSRQRGYTFVWPVPATAAGGAWAMAVCRAINRQKKGPEPEEPRKAKLSCDIEPDPRRGVVVLRPSGTEDPWQLVRTRLARLGPGGADTALMQAQAATVAQAIALAARTPQGLARMLAMGAAPAAPGGATNFQQQHRVEELTGAASLADPAGREKAAPGLLRVEDAVVLTYPEGR
jgi:hypothetical protein